MNGRSDLRVCLVPLIKMHPSSIRATNLRPLRLGTNGGDLRGEVHIVGGGGGFTRGGSFFGRPVRFRFAGRPRLGRELTRDERRGGPTGARTTVGVVGVGVGGVGGVVAGVGRVTGVRLAFFRSARSRWIPRCISWLPSSSWYQVCVQKKGGASK